MAYAEAVGIGRSLPTSRPVPKTMVQELWHSSRPRENLINAEVIVGSDPLDSAGRSMSVGSGAAFADPTRPLLQLPHPDNEETTQEGLKGSSLASIRPRDERTV